MATAATKLITAEEFYEWVNRPENKDKYCELERGEIVEMSRPGKRHGFVCSNVVVILWSYARQRKKGYVCSNDTGWIVERDPDTVRGPDIMFFEDAATYEELDKGFSSTPPRLSVEVLSPNDTPSKLQPRIEEQIQSGVPLIWVIDPESCTVRVIQPGKDERVLGENEELVCEDVLPGFRCLVADFFKLPGSP